MKFLRHLLGITKLDKENNQCIRGGNGSTEQCKGNKTVASTRREWTQTEYQNKHCNTDRKEEGT
jgi:hypothetical protein